MINHSSNLHHISVPQVFRHGLQYAQFLNDLFIKCVFDESQDVL